MVSVTVFPRARNASARASRASKSRSSWLAGNDKAQANSISRGISFPVSVNKTMKRGFLLARPGQRWRAAFHYPVESMFCKYVAIKLDQPGWRIWPAEVTLIERWLVSFHAE